MTGREFNEKYADHLKERHYGMSISHPDVIDYLDKEFAKEIEVNPDFQFSQIKTKFNWVCVYCNSDKQGEWEQAVLKILQADGEL